MPMKFPIKPFILIFVVAVFASCSRQLTNINCTGKLLTVSNTVTPNITIRQILLVKSEALMQNHKIDIAKSNGAQQVYEDSCVHIIKKKSHTAVVKANLKKVIHIAITYPPVFSLLPKHIADRGNPQINKGGFILIGAAILAFFLKLLPIACIALFVLGLIILLSPLFRKRY